MALQRWTQIFHTSDGRMKNLWPLYNASTSSHAKNYLLSLWPKLDSNLLPCALGVMFCDLVHLYKSGWTIMNFQTLLLLSECWAMGNQDNVLTIICFLLYRSRFFLALIFGLYRACLLFANVAEWWRPPLPPTISQPLLLYLRYLITNSWYLITNRALYNYLSLHIGKQFCHLSPNMSLSLSLLVLPAVL